MESCVVHVITAHLEISTYVHDLYSPPKLRERPPACWHRQPMEINSNSRSPTSDHVPGDQTARTDEALRNPTRTLTTHLRGQGAQLTAAGLRASAGRVNSPPDWHGSSDRPSSGSPSSSFPHMQPFRGIFASSFPSGIPDLWIPFHASPSPVPQSC